MAEAQGQMAARKRLLELRDDLLRRQGRHAGLTELTEGEFKQLIQYWNSQLAEQRQRDAAVCRQEGHRPIRTPLRDDGHPITVCLSCLTYQSTAPSRYQGRVTEVSAA